MKNLQITLLALSVLISMPSIGMQREEKLVKEEISSDPFYNRAALEVLPINIQIFLSNYIDSRNPRAMARAILQIASFSPNNQNLMNNPNTMLSILEGFRNAEDAIEMVESLRNNAILPVLLHPRIESWRADARARIYRR